MLKHKKSIIIRESLTDGEMEKKCRRKSGKKAYTKHEGSTEALEEEAKRHPLYVVLTSDNVLSDTGSVLFNNVSYYKGGGEDHVNALAIAIVKRTITMAESNSKRKKEISSLDVTTREFVAMKRSEKETKKATKNAKLVPLPKGTEGKLGTVILATFRTAFKDDTVAVSLLGDVYEWFMSRGMVEKFPTDDAEMSGNGYIQKDRLFSTIGGDYHDCHQIKKGDRVVNVTKCSMNVLVDILQDIADEKHHPGHDYMTGKRPDTNFKPFWYQIMLLSRVAQIYSLIDQPKKFMELLRLLPGSVISGEMEEARNSHVGQVCHGCNNGPSTITDDMSCCLNPDCLRFGTFELNKLDDTFYNALIAVCNSDEHTKESKIEYVTGKMKMYKMEVKAQTGREVEILFQLKKEEFEKFKARPTPAAAKELLKRYLPIGIAGYESLTPTEDEE